MSISMKRRSIFEIFLLCLVLVLLNITGNKGNAQEEKSEPTTKGLKVTLLLYSGRSNPTFFLDDKESVKMLKSLVDKSKETKSFEKETVVPSVLGYNGIVVENLGGTVERFPVSLVLYKGVIEVMNKRKIFLYDEGNEIESFLLSKAMERKVIDKYALRKIKAEK